MKTAIPEALITFVLGGIVSATAMSWLLQHSPNVLRCKTGDLSRPAATDDVSSPASAKDGWLRNARRCDLGEYSVVTPVQSGHRAILLFRNDSVSHTVFAATSDATNLFDPDGKRGLRGLAVQLGRDAISVFNVGGSGELLTLRGESIALSDPASKRVLVNIDRSPVSRMLSYSTYDPSRTAWTESVVGPDGNVDLRMTEIPGHPMKTEVRVGNLLLERVEHDGQTRVNVDGHFMSIADARAKFGVKAKSRSK